ncbi:MAG: serine hydrolase domain-containing protein [Legionellales bacterium]|jgi:beta-lactamase class C
MKSPIINFFMLVTLLITAPLVYAQTANMDTLIKQLDASAQQAMKASGAPGMAMAIVQNNKIVFMKGYGVRKAGQPAQVTTDTVFRVASVSKPFTSTLTGILVEKQLMSWDDKVVQYVPAFALKSPTNTQNLTVRDLLSHQGGLPSHAYDDLIEANVPYETVRTRLREVNPTCAPGNCYNYQNVLYSVTADVIKARTGKTFDQAMREQVFIPLGMNSASTTYEAMINHPNAAQPHVKSNGRWVSTKIKPTYYRVAPAGGVNASIKDMANWLRAEMGHRPDVLSPSVISTITTPAVTTNSEIYKYHSVKWRQARVKKAQYGLGWRIYDYAGRKMVYHRGGIEGYRAEVAYLPTEQIGIVTLWNSGAHVSDTMIPTLFDAYLGLPKTNWVQLAGNK